MTLEKMLYLLPYLFSFAVSLSILIFTWNRWRVNAAGEFGWFLFGQNLWLLSFIIGLVSTSLSGKLLWDKVEWVAALVSVASLPFFVARYIHKSPQKNRLGVCLALILPVLFTILLFTDSYHHLIYSNIGIVQRSVFSELQRTYLWPADLIAGICALVSLASMVYLVLREPNKDSLRRLQTIIIAIGVILPVVGVFLSYLDVQIIPGRDPGPIAAVIGDFIIAWGLFRFYLFDLIPIARETILENMDDMVIVLDSQDRIVIANKKALSELRMNSRQVLDRSVTKVLAIYPDLIEEFKVPQNVTTEVIFDGEHGYYHYDIKCTLLNDRFGNFQGRIFVARDVTKYAELQWRLQDLNENLERRVAEQTKQLAESYETTLEGWAKALELRDKETEGHSRRVTEKTVELARAYGIQESEIDHIRRGAILHDIGKMAIPDEILRAKKQLTDEDWVIIRKHPVTAYELLRKIPFLQPAMDIPYCHHEHWNGTGYPRGLKGQEIPIAARLFSVVDVWDALLSNRAYSHAWKKEEVVQYIKEKSGKEFDPEVVSIFLKMEG